MTVYVVLYITPESYDDCGIESYEKRIVGVFSTLEKAHQYIGNRCNFIIDDWTIDDE